MVKSILFFCGWFWAGLAGLCQDKQLDKQGGQIKVLVNLNRLTDSERRVFVNDYKEYILAPAQGGSRKKVVAGETLGTIIDTAYGIEQGNPIFDEYVDRIAAINHLGDKNTILVDQYIQLPATVYKSPLASEIHDLIATTPGRTRLSSQEKRNLDSIARIAKAKQDYRITVKSYAAYSVAENRVEGLTKAVYSYLKNKWDVASDRILVKTAGYNPRNCIDCNVVGVDANWAVDIYKSDAAVPVAWVGRPQFSYQLDHSKPANLAFDIPAEDFARIISGDKSRFFFLLVNSNKLSLRDFPKRPALIKLLEGSNGTMPPKIIPERLTTDLAALDTADFGMYYILDVFREGKCLHGTKVYEVVKEVLESYHLGKALSKVDTIPINYFTNRKKCDSVYMAYTRLDGVDGLDKDVTTYGPPVDSITFAQYAGDDKYSPENYLSAINILLISKGPSIISSSFTVGCSSDILTPAISSDTLLSGINFIAAATNTDTSIEIYRRPQGSSLTDRQPYVEPLMSYMASSPNLGTIIVGDALSDTVFAGNFSSDGTHITCLGMGTNWGGVDVCLHPTESGTSLATPEVGAKLFIAKAWWKKQKIPVNSIEARRRLILSTNLQPRFVGSFASGGMVSLDKLLQTSNAYLVSMNGEIIPIDTIDMSTIQYHQYSFGLLKSGDFQGTDDESLRGLYWVNKKFYIFNEKTEKWAGINDVYKLNIGSFIHGKYTPIYLSDFGTKYKQLVILRP